MIVDERDHRLHKRSSSVRPKYAEAFRSRPLEGLGYAFWADNPRQDRLFFVKGPPPAAAHRTHHVHMAEPDVEMWRRLPFRDYLRAHLEGAARYAALKRDLATRHAQDREAYTTAKSAFVNMILERA